MIAIVSTFPPLRDGIAKYAAQQAALYREKGEDVLTVGHAGSNADIVLELCGGIRALGLEPAVRARAGADARVTLSVHWHDGLYYAGGFARRLLTDFALTRALRAFPGSEIVCHETYALEPARDPVRAVLRAAHASARRRVWLAAGKIVFHSQGEREKMERAVGLRLSASQVELRPHGAAFRRYRDVTREEARKELGLPPDRTILLCIGFLGEHKGFHRAVTAFGKVASPTAMLYIVGSALTDDVPSRAYIERLREQIAATPGVTLVEEYVSDEAFDTWMAACDVVLAPYENAFSSSVVERAKLFVRPVVASGVGGIADQLTDRDRVFRTDDELALILAEMAEARR